MKRAIKFRGKRYNNGDWVVGDLQMGDDDHIPMIGVVGPGRWVDYTQVHEETIGQFTGLHDKNGEEIYEGDIIKQIGYSGNVKAVVQFDKGCFMCGWHHGSSTQRTPRLIQSRCEVLGNIHDNPDYWKEEKELTNYKK